MCRWQTRAVAWLRNSRARVRLTSSARARVLQAMSAFVSIPWRSKAAHTSSISTFSCKFIQDMRNCSLLFLLVPASSLPLCLKKTKTGLINYRVITRVWPTDSLVINYSKITRDGPTDYLAINYSEITRVWPTDSLVINYSKITRG